MRTPRYYPVKPDDSKYEPLTELGKSATRHVLLRRPCSEDGVVVHQLIKNCPPLDENSIYCNLLQTSHFAGTSIAAVIDNKLVGFASGYLVPERPDTLFIWQVAVAQEARGQGLAWHMIQGILRRPACARVCNLETTVTPGNTASEALFRSFARRFEGTFSASVMFERERHFQGLHDSERLLRIGLGSNPLPRLVSTVNQLTQQG